MQPHHDQQGRRLLRQNEQHLRDLLDTLDEGEQGRNDSRRRHKRFAFRLDSCTVHLQQPGDGWMNPFMVHTRNLSVQGMAFLHGQFVHKGTIAAARLRTTAGTEIEVRGTIVNCRYIRAGVHEVSMRFDNPLDMEQFLQPSQTFSVLVIEADESAAALAKHTLAEADATATLALNPDQVEAEVGKTFDLVLIDRDYLELYGFDELAALRAAKCGSLVIGAMCYTDEDRARCLEAGATLYIPKPTTADRFAQVLERASDRPLLSRHQGREDMQPLVMSFLRKLPDQIQQLKDAAEGNPGRLEVLARMLKSAAEGHGFESMAKVAGELEEAARSGAHPVTACFDLLEHMAARAQTPVQTKAA